MKMLLLRHLELVLTAVGLLIIEAAFLLTPPAVNRWMVCAGTAIAVGVIHGVLGWAVRHRQRLAREQALEETRHMLRDVVMNQLTIIRFSFDLRDDHSEKGTEALTCVQGAIDKISVTLADVSEESLAKWRSHYDLSMPCFAEKCGPAAPRPQAELARR